MKTWRVKQVYQPRNIGQHMFMRALTRSKAPHIRHFQYTPHFFHFCFAWLAIAQSVWITYGSFAILKRVSFSPLRQPSWSNRWVVKSTKSLLPGKNVPVQCFDIIRSRKNPLSLIENPHKSPFRNFFYDHSKVELFSFLCSNFYKKILSITRQRKDATAVAQLTLFFERSRFLQ